MAGPVCRQTHPFPQSQPVLPEVTLGLLAVVPAEVVAMLRRRQGGLCLGCVLVLCRWLGAQYQGGKGMKKRGRLALSEPAEHQGWNSHCRILRALCHLMGDRTVCHACVCVHGCVCVLVSSSSYKATRIQSQEAILVTCPTLTTHRPHVWTPQSNQASSSSL